MTRTITAFFDSRTEAQAAADKLRTIGVADVGIHDTTATTERTAARTGDEDKGFLASLSDLFLPDDDRYAYEEGVRRGGSVVTVRADEAEFDRVSDVLEEAGAVDLDTREAEWRTEGWSGGATDYRTTTDAAGASVVGTTSGTSTLAGAGSASAPGATAVGGVAGTTREDDASTREDDGAGRRAEFADVAARGRDGTIEVVEENLKVGKRDVSHGRVRVRSYVREEAVSEDVSLHSERVEIERRPVDRVLGAGEDPFRDRTLELEERGEEAVVSKEARVKEEIDLRTVGSDRTETVSDTVRRTEVDVEDERHGRSLTEDEVREQSARETRPLGGASTDTGKKL